jgi:hypothetical protein
LILQEAHQQKASSKACGDSCRIPRQCFEQTYLETCHHPSGNGADIAASNAVLTLPFEQFPPYPPIARVCRWCSTHHLEAVAVPESLTAFLRPSVLSLSVFVDNAQLMAG